MKAKLTWIACLFAAPALALAYGQQAPHATTGSTNCAVCHGQENRELESSIHTSAGVGCIACHGGSPDALDVAGAHGAHLAGLRDPRAAVESCGGCHADVERMRSFALRTDQLSLYTSSPHGQRLAKDGDPNVATCVSCHGSHAVLKASDPLSPVHPAKQAATCGLCHSDAAKMAKYGLRADQEELYRKSVHGRALLDLGHRSAPVCSDCHGSHGAVPPRVQDVAMVCGRCHSTVESYFLESPHAKPGSATAGAHASMSCVACHSNHLVTTPSSAMFLGDEAGHCGSCHSGAHDRALAVASKLHDDVESLVATIEDAQRAVGEAAQRGLFLGDERGYLDDARGVLVRARTMTHTLSPTMLDDALSRSHALVGQSLSALATKQRVFRDRKLVTAIFFGICIAFAIALWMYGRVIRGTVPRMRRRASQPGASA